MSRGRKMLFGGSLVAAVALLGVGQAALEAMVAENRVLAPRFEVDPYWPKPLPNGWIFGNVIGVEVDANDNVYLVHRSDTPVATELWGQGDAPQAMCCSAAPPLVQFDREGNLVRAWGGPSPTNEYVWPASNHGVGVDDQGNVWIGGNGGGDSHVLMFTNDGRYIRTYGEPGNGSDSQALNHFGMVADIEFDLAANEAYFADGYGNKRVAVVDITTGAIKRFWGAYGQPPVDGFQYVGVRTAEANFDASQVRERAFRGPTHCADPSKDGLVYVCDRQNNRVQVFRLDGTYVTEGYYGADTLGDGATWDVAFSNDAAQTWMYLVDGKNARIRIIRRATMEEVGTVGTGGRYVGQFQAAHSIASDSRGDFYVTETYEGRRIHKFVFMGVGEVPQHQGAAWPAARD